MAKAAINPKGTEKAYEVFRFPQATKADGDALVEVRVIDHYPET